MNLTLVNGIAGLGAVLAAALLMAFGSVASASSDPVFGRWLSENRNAVIEIAPCGDSACGRMVWLRDPIDGAGRPKTAANGAPLCGYRLADGFKRGATGQWVDGEIVNPRDGRVYSALMAYRDDGTLEVRGYAGLKILGSSQIWTPAPSYLPAC